MSSDMPYSEYSLLSKNEDVYDQINSIQEWLKGLPQELEEEIRAELDAIMQKVLAQAIENVPKDTGALASSISLEGGALEKSASGNFYEASIFAGNDSIINPISGKPTSEYALFVHDGHFTVDGKWIDGVPFLQDALDQYQDELDSIVDKVLSEKGWNRED